MDKRKSLAVFGLALLSYAAASRNALAKEQVPASKKKRLLVIGAGLAGLATAKELQRHGHDVVVLEARDRIGGRIWTSTKWPDMPLDFGATWIHGVKGNPLTGLADDIRADRVATKYERSITYNTSGQALSKAEGERLDALTKQVFGALKNAQDRNADISIRQAIEPLMRQFDESSEAYRFINFALGASVEQEYSGSAAQLSASWYGSAKEFGGGDVFFVQGFRVVTEFLAKGLNIQLDQAVREVQWQQSPVRVVTQKSEFVADHVVVTLPLGVLQARSVRFTPELPKAKQNAIAKLGMGVLNKCYLRFPEAFWPADVDWLEYIPARHGEWTEWVSFKRSANVPILLGFNAADRGRAIEQMSDAQIVASAMQTLKTMFGAKIPNPIDYQLTRWASDPFALGSYSFNRVGSTPKMRKELAAPLGAAVSFAGEATEDNYFGTAHGAYMSGLRAARNILAM